MGMSFVSMALVIYSHLYNHTYCIHWHTLFWYLQFAIHSYIKSNSQRLSLIKHVCCVKCFWFLDLTQYGMHIFSSEQAIERLNESRAETHFHTHTRTNGNCIWIVFVFWFIIYLPYVPIKNALLCSNSFNSEHTNTLQLRIIMMVTKSTHKKNLCTIP